MSFCSVDAEGIRSKYSGLAVMESIDILNDSSTVVSFGLQRVRAKCCSRQPSSQCYAKRLTGVHPSALGGLRFLWAEPIDSTQVIGMLQHMPEIDVNNLPDEVDALRALIVAQLELNKTSEKRTHSLNDALDQQPIKHIAALKEASAKQQALKQHIVVLEQQLAVLRRARFGKQSEKLDEHILQLELMIEDLETTLAEPAAPSEPEVQAGKRKSRARKPLPEHLPREVIEHGKRDCCEQCGSALSKIGDDVSEQLEYVPSSFRVIRHVRPKYSCKCCSTIVQAPAPSRPIPGSYAGPGLLAHVAVAKFCDHLPLYRQSQIYSREGVALERSTLADWVGQVCLQASTCRTYT